MTLDPKRPKCICGSPCKAALFNSFVGCTNPGCKWFDNDVIRDMKAAQDELLRVFGTLP